MRWKEPPRTPAVVLIVSVFARPGTPSIRRWPPERRHTSTRSSIASWPAMTRLISYSACSSCALGGRSHCVSVTWAPFDCFDPPDQELSTLRGGGGARPSYIFLYV